MGDEPKTICAAALADLLWNTIIINDMFDEKLAPVRGALREACGRLVGYAITGDEHGQ